MIKELKEYSEKKWNIEGKPALDCTYLGCKLSIQCKKIKQKIRDNPAWNIY